MDLNVVNSILGFIKQLEGKTISVGNTLDNLKFIEESKRMAREHEWVFHCTTDISLLSILKNSELWLSNLKLVNDKQEVARVDVPEYEKTYYVSCFTYDPQIPKEHWEEYGNMQNGVLIGIKPEWVKRTAVFMCGNNQKCDSEFSMIFENEDAALNYKMEQQQNGRLTNPFYINAFDFYQVVYNDELIKNIKESSSMEINGQVFSGQSLTPAVAGIIKSTKGICQRWGVEPYEKDWSTEKEVRLKVGIQQLDILANGNEIHDDMIMKEAFFPKIAVALTEDAFEEVKIKFSPAFKDRKAYLKKVENMLPGRKIEVL